MLPAYHEDANGNVDKEYSNTRDGYEPLLLHAFAPLFALYLYASSTADDEQYERPGLFERLFSHKALVSLGDFSFVVYLFQAPVFRTYEAIYIDRFIALQKVEPKLVAAALFTLYVASGALRALYRGEGCRISAACLGWVGVAAGDGWFSANGGQHALYSGLRARAVTICGVHGAWVRDQRGSDVIYMIVLATAPPKFDARAL